MDEKTRRERYKYLFRKFPAFMTMIDHVEGKYLDASDAWLARLGYTREEFTRLSFRDVYTPESVDFAEKSALPQLRRTGRAENHPMQALTKDGEILEVMLEGIAERDDDGNMLWGVGHFTELGDLAKVERHFRMLYRTTPAMLFTADLDWRIQAVSDLLLESLGYGAEEMAGRPISGFLTTAARGAAAGQLTSAVAEADFLKECPLDFRTKDGRVVETLLFAYTERDGRGVPQRVLGALHDVTERNEAEREKQRAFEEIARLKDRIEKGRNYLRVEINIRFEQIIAASEELQEVLNKVAMVGPTPANVMIQGESGVGKELVARAIHKSSRRGEEGEFVRVNCASVAPTLFESEFFGHVRGAFTNAHKDRVGKVELADRGTLFLDEVTEIPMELQAKLLNVVQHKEFERVGDVRPQPSDVRIVAATNRDPEKEIAENRFREDLFYRLNVFPIEVPPLRRRISDILPLARHFLKRTCSELGREPMELSDENQEMLLEYRWPGNVRELQNVLERAVILSSGDDLRLEAALPGAAQTPERFAGVGPGRITGSERGFLTEEELRRREKANMLAALEAAGWQIDGDGGAAELLGMKSGTLRYRMKKFGLKKPPPGAS